MTHDDLKDSMQAQRVAETILMVRPAEERETTRGTLVHHLERRLADYRAHLSNKRHLALTLEPRCERTRAQRPFITTAPCTGLLHVTDYQTMKLRKVFEDMGIADAFDSEPRQAQVLAAMTNSDLLEFYGRLLLLLSDTYLPSHDQA